MARREHTIGTAEVLRDLLTAFAEPGSVNAGLAAQVIADAIDVLEVIEGGTRDPGRQRMPTLLFPRSAVNEVPDPPPVPPAAL